MKIAILYLCRPYIVKEFSDAMEDLLAVDREGRNLIQGRVLRQKCPPYPNLYRNQLTMEAFRRWPDLKLVVWLDDDESFTPEDFYKLVDLVDYDTRPIVSGLYFAVGHDGKVRPLVASRRPDGEGFATIWQYPRNALVQVGNVGMGFCAIHARCLVQWAEKHGPTWFDYSRTPKGRFMIEESSFSVRMGDAGHTLWVHTGIIVKHWKTIPIDQRYFDAQTALHEKELQTPPPELMG
jgi:hypothetical protein